MNNDILNWYNFKSNSSILYIEDDFNFQKVNKKYDYVIFYDLNQIEEVLKLLNEDAVAILMVDNKFSIANFAGSKPTFGNVYDTITKDDGKTFSKNQIENKLKSFSLKYKFYYALPNYTKPNVIFSDNYLPHENTTKLMYNVSYLAGSTVVFDELNALKQLTKDNRFADFANSYIVEIGNVSTNQPRCISYNNSRKAEFRLITKIFDDRVEKIPACKEANVHIDAIYDNTNSLRNFGFDLLEQKQKNIIVSQFVNCDTYDKTIAKSLLQNDIDKAINEIKLWYSYISEKLPSTEDNGLHITKYGYIDLVFENSFFKDDKFVFFDQEWFLENIPVEFILYRAIKNLYAYNREINDIMPYDKMTNVFDLSKYQEEFEKLEKDFQNKVIDSQMIQKNIESLNWLIDVNELKLINDYKENNRKQDEYIKALEEENRKKQEYINILEKNQRLFFRRK